MPKWILFSFFSLICSQWCMADISSVKMVEPIMNQYERAVFDVQLKAQWTNPYRESDVALLAVITTPSGKTLRLPGFYVSGDSKKLSNWRFHFAPREVGAYQFSIELQDDQRTKGKPKVITANAKPGSKPGFLQVNDLWTLKFDNGQLFRGVGENFGWEHRDEDDSRYFKALHEDPRFTYDVMLPKLHQQGANFIRTWMIFWNLPIDWQTVNNASRYKNSSERFNASGITRMDDLISLAENNNIYLMLAMDSHAGFIGENWDINPYNRKNGGFASTPEEFFSSPEARQQYQEKLRYLVARWGYSANIAAWEFFNEVDNVMYATDKTIPDAMVTEWHQVMSDYLADIDPYNHIITTSISHRDVAGMNDLPNIDINQRHIYKATDKIPDILRDYSAQAKKPYVIGEFGFEWDWSINFNDVKAGMVGDFKKGLWYGLFSPTPVMPMSWWWEYFDEHGTTAYFAHVQEINQLILQTSTQPLKEMNVQANLDRVSVLAIDNGSKQFIYLHNPQGRSQTVQLQLPPQFSASTANVQIFDAETATYKQLARVNKGKLTGVKLPAHSNSILILH